MKSHLLVAVIGVAFLLGASAARADDAMASATKSADVAGNWDSPWGVITLWTAPVKGKNLLSVREFPTSPAPRRTSRKGLIRRPASITHAKNLEVGGGGVFASLDDMARWDAGWRQGKIIKPATQKLALVTSTYGDNIPNVYAFGWGVTVTKGRLLRMAHFLGKLCRVPILHRPRRRGTANPSRPVQYGQRRRERNCSHLQGDAAHGQVAKKRRKIAAVQKQAPTAVRMNRGFFVLHIGLSRVARKAWCTVR